MPKVMKLQTDLLKYSQRGNDSFPVWEHFVPNVGIISQLAKNQRILLAVCLFCSIFACDFEYQS